MEVLSDSNNSISLFQIHIKVSFYQNSYTIKVLKLNAAF